MLDMFNSFAIEKFNTEEDKLMHNAIFANGIFQLRESHIGTFIYKSEKGDFTKYGLTQNQAETFIPDHTSIPKIPFGILQEVIKLYRKVAETIKSEVYCAIVWDKVKKDFFIHVPVQEVAVASITYTNTESIYNNPDYIVVMDLH